MVVELHNLLRDPQVKEATQVIVRDIYGDPLIIALEQQPGTYTVAHRGDNNFPKVLAALGLHTTIITEHIAPPQPHSLITPDAIP
jgi:hypothetical protein